MSTGRKIIAFFGALLIAQTLCFILKKIPSFKKIKQIETKL